MANVEKFKKSRVVRTMRATVEHDDTGLVYIGTLPRGARIINWLVHITTLFAGGAATFTIGTAADADYFVTAMTNAAAGTYVPDTEDAVPGHTTTAITDVYFTQATGATAGAMHIECNFALDVERSIR